MALFPRPRSLKCAAWRGEGRLQNSTNHLHEWGGGPLWHSTFLFVWLGVGLRFHRLPTPPTPGPSTAHHHTRSIPPPPATGREGLRFRLLVLRLSALRSRITGGRCRGVRTSMSLSPAVSRKPIDSYSTDYRDKMTMMIKDQNTSIRIVHLNRDIRQQGIVFWGRSVPGSTAPLSRLSQSEACGWLAQLVSALLCLPVAESSNAARHACFRENAGQAGGAVGSDRPTQT